MNCLGSCLGGSPITSNQRLILSTNNLVVVGTAHLPRLLLLLLMADGSLLLKTRSYLPVVRFPSLRRRRSFTWLVYEWKKRDDCQYTRLGDHWRTASVSLFLSWPRDDGQINVSYGVRAGSETYSLSLSSLVLWALLPLGPIYNQMTIAIRNRSSV